MNFPGEQLSLADILTPECVMGDPYPSFHRLRERGPLYWDQPLQSWVTTSYTTSITLLHDTCFSPNAVSIQDTLQLPSSVIHPFLPSLQVLGKMLFIYDSPDHERLRNLFAGPFTPRYVETLRGHIQHLCDELLDALMRREEIDLLDDFAYPFLTRVLADLLSVPPEDRERFFLWSYDLDLLLVESPRPLDEARQLLQQLDAFVDYFRHLISKEKHLTENVFLQRLVRAWRQEKRLSENELLGSLILLPFAGLVPTAQMLGSCIYNLLRYPDQLQLVLADLPLLSVAIEELLRYDSPILGAQRVARENLRFQSQDIKAGQFVAIGLAAANRDPDHFPDPDRLDLTRQGRSHLTFGYGHHFCLGAHLSRLSIEIALATFFRRFRNLTLARIEREPRRFSRYFKKLSLTLAHA